MAVVAIGCWGMAGLCVCAGSGPGPGSWPWALAQGGGWMPGVRMGQKCKGKAKICHALLHTERGERLCWEHPMPPRTPHSHAHAVLCRRLPHTTATSWDSRSWRTAGWRPAAGRWCHTSSSRTRCAMWRDALSMGGGILPPIPNPSSRPLPSQIIFVLSSALNPGNEGKSGAGGGGRSAVSPLTSAVGRDGRAYGEARGWCEGRGLRGGGL